MKKYLLTTLVLSLFSLGLMAQDQCTDWSEYYIEGRKSGLYLKTCQYESGGSGYYKLKNTNGKDVRVHFKIVFNDGTSFKGSTNIKAYSQTSGSSCFKCAAKNSGAKNWTVTKYAFKGEEGYW